MNKILNIFLRFAKAGAMLQFEYRFQAISWAVISIFWMFLSMVSVSLIFGQVETIAGWTRDEAMLLTICTSLFVSLLWVFVQPSTLSYAELVYRGSFDFYLLKPINLRFLISTHKVEVDNIPRIFVSTYLIAATISKMPVSIDFLSILMFLVFLLIGLIIFYNLFFMFSTLVFFFTNLFNLEDLFGNILDVGKYPVYIFQGGWKVIFTLILPAAFIATFPIQALLGRSNVETFFGGIFLVIVSSILSQAFFNFAVKKYSSAN